MEIIYKFPKLIKLLFEDIKHYNDKDWTIFLNSGDPAHLLELYGFKMQYSEKIKWYLFSGNLGAVHLLEKHQDYINWRDLSKNPDGIYLLKEKEEYKGLLIVRIKGENDDSYWFSTEQLSDDNYFYTFFESFAEFREKRIDSILND